VGKKNEQPKSFYSIRFKQRFFYFIKEGTAEKKGTFFDFAPLFFESGFAPLFFESGFAPLFFESGFAPLFFESGFAPLFFESGFAPLVGLSNEIKKLERPPKKSFF